MRQRQTYLLPSGSGVDPNDIEVGKDHLSFAGAGQAAVETRITVGLSELPKELQSILEDFHELHIRLASHRSYIPFLPTVSRVPSGLHIFFTPRNPGQETKLCSLLQEIVSEDIQCGSNSETFSRPHVLSERFASSSTYQFFHGPDDLANISEHIGAHFCEGLPVGSEIGQICKFLADAGSCAYVDYDYDVISHAVTITTLSTLPNGQARLEQAISHKFKPEDRLEVGILAPESPDEPEELKLGGYLTVVGDDDKPSATLFGFPARHHPLPAGDLTAYQVSFQAPTGLHTKLDIKFPAQHLRPPKDNCALHAYTTLPASLFIDRYQLDDKLFLESNNLVALRALSGEQDLEAPNWVLNQWGSAALLELNYPQQKSTSTDDWTVTIPMHLRYVNGTSDMNKAGAVDLSWPVVFWACEAEEGLKMSTNPFDRVNLGYDGLFGPKTMFYHVPPSPTADVLVERLSVPFLDPTKAEWVPLGTSFVVLLGFAWICYKLFGGSASPRRDEKKTQ
ncbi:Protein pbn1 [Pseudocercospora fuligena]|uniref:Protein PBN1 n=1 Tax=Pseudocercospora fuligena TaxID=685502 RepID=A0A8H6VKB6_9PEZI|nr:Protein pbn1 [Pseudocercospora fuligena]